jgi:hypothetical protein
MYGKTIILLNALFISFILQFDSDSSFGQIQAQEIPNLKGIWDRVDNYGYNDTIYVNQIGNEITATADWACLPDLYNRQEGTEYAPFKKIFTGKLTENTATGQFVTCLPDLSTTKLDDMKLTVSDDGKTIDVDVTSDTGSYFQQFTFISELPADILIELRTSKPAYNPNEQIQVVGEIKNLASDVNTLFLEVYAPEGKRALYRDVSVNPDGTFSDSFDLNNKTNNGRYLAHVAYASADKEISFDYGTPIGGIYQPIIATGIGIAVVAGGGFLLHKHGYVQRIEQLFNNDSQNQQTSNLPVIYVGVECGLENAEILKEPELNRNAIGQGIVRVEQTFSKAMDDILQNRKAIKNVQKDIDFVKWCREAKENPNKILSKISDDILNKLLSSMSTYFGNLIVREINVDTDVSVTKDKRKKIRKNVQFNLVPIEPYIEFVLYINSQRISSAKFIFTIETNVEVKNLDVNMTKTKSTVEETLQDRLEQTYDKKISIESLIFAITVEFSKLRIAHIEKNISPPIIIGTKKVQLKKFGSSDR